MEIYCAMLLVCYVLVFTQFETPVPVSLFIYLFFALELIILIFDLVTSKFLL
jgi:hypothetical protein